MSGFSALADIFQLKYNWKLVCMFLSSSTEVCTTLNLIESEVFFSSHTQLFFFFFCDCHLMFQWNAAAKLLWEQSHRSNQVLTFVKSSWTWSCNPHFFSVVTLSIHPLFYRASFFFKLYIKPRQYWSMFYEKILFQSLCFKISHLKFGPGKIFFYSFFILGFERSLFCSLSCIYQI